MAEKEVSTSWNGTHTEAGFQPPISPSGPQLLQHFFQVDEPVEIVPAFATFEERGGFLFI